MLNFCTLFDSNYLARGLVTYESLMQNTEGGKNIGLEKSDIGQIQNLKSQIQNPNTEPASPLEMGSAHLYVFAFDDKCYNVLTKMALPNMTVISLSEFEDEALLAIKSSRSRGEYCWTCTSSTIYYVLNKLGLPNCTYIDADMFFYQNPKVLIDEMPADKHVIITEHRYTPQYDKSKLSGKYCVQFMYFDNTPESLDVLTWWRDRCLEWCYNRHEDGKFGDQKYLDDWTTRFKCVHELKHLGGGLAPWNIQRFDFSLNQNKIEGKVVISKGLEQIQNQNTEPAFPLGMGSSFEAVFFHYHGVKLYEQEKFILAPKMYALKPTVKALFYESYLLKLKEAGQKVRQIDPSFDSNGTQSLSQYQKDRRKGWGSYVKTNFINKIFG